MTENWDRRDIVEQLSDFFQIFMLGVMKPIEKQLRGEVPNSGLHVMSHIYFKGPATMSDITSILQCSKQQTTQTVDKLIKSGHAVRESDESDRRKVWIKLTDEGNAYVEKMLKTVTELFTDRLEQLDPDDIRSISEAVSTLNRLFGKISETDIEKVDIKRIIRQEDKI